MRSYSHQVPPSESGGPANPFRGRPARLALLALSTFVVGTAVPGSAVQLPGLSTKIVLPGARASPPTGPAPPAPAGPNSGKSRPPQRIQHAVIVRLPKPKPAPKPWLPTGTGMWIHEW